MTDQQESLRPGARVNWYEIRDILGQGGFGVTYAGLDTNLNQEVAFKEYFPLGCARRLPDGTVRPHSNFEAEDTFSWGLERFIDEARTLAQFRHPNVVRVLSVFESNGTAYMVMELEHGQSLEELIREKRIRNEATLLSLLVPVLDGLDYIHANGFIHRDIKPANILVRPSKTAVLLDFGSARQVTTTGDQMLTSVVSRGFAPFEQYETGGEENREGAWTDIYGLGATLYAVVTGKMPKDAMTRGTRLLGGHPDPMSPAEPMEGTDYSARLLGAIDGALAFQIEDRPQSVSAWREMMPTAPVAGGRTGDTLVIETPRHRTSAPARRVTEAAAPPPPEPQCDLSHLSIMIVDDEPFVRNLTKRVLTTLGIENVTQAGDGEQALAMLEAVEPEPDIILSDLRMPGMDGIEFLRHLGERRTRSGLVLMSGANQRVLTTTESLAQSHKLNILGTLQKPVKPDALRGLLNRFDPNNTNVSKGSGIEPLTEEELIAGLACDELHVVYQPKVSVRERRMEGIEALARWNHPTRGMLGPGAFIGLAETTGHIDALTEGVFSKAMAQAGQWRADGLELNVSVNFSVDTLSRFDLPEFLISTAEAEGMDPGLVILEVTESRVMEDVRAPLEILTRLNLHGVGLSIDDFGTGHSSLEQIRRIPFTELKIDRAFVSGASKDAAARAILESSVTLAKNLDLHTVAEGVETQADWDLIAALGCDTVQGYFSSRPIEGSEIPAFAEKWQNG
jgi:EAL domain-containing protein (putative c-di-GMP-specific phosphodiesterase class I)/serine/threonine protein kinase